MNGFDTIFSQNQPIRTLKRFLKKQSIPHALLFTGIEGVGKQLTALTFAMGANCTGRHQAADSPPEEGMTQDGGSKTPIDQKTEPCGICRSCKKIQSHNHPDVLFIEPSGAMIKIHQIRHLLKTLSLKPYEARVRIVVIINSHAMNPPAANALLKVLEEPPERTVLILTANETSDLLPTIVSRCRHIRFNPISVEDISRLLNIKESIHPEQADVLAAMAGGSYTKALDMSRLNWIQRRNWLITAGGLEAPEKLADRPASLLLAFAEFLAKDRSTVDASLDVIKTWLRDLIVWKYTPDKIMHKDLAERVADASKNSPAGDLIKKLEIVEETQRDIKANMNLRLCLDILMLRLAATY